MKNSLDNLYTFWQNEHITSGIIFNTAAAANFKEYLYDMKLKAKEVHRNWNCKWNGVFRY